MNEDADKGEKRAGAEAPASERVRKEWLRRVEAEYRSAAISQELTLWLIQVGASPDLIKDGLRIVSDELGHAELSHQVYVEGGGVTPPAIGRETLRLRRQTSESLETAITRAGVEVFCLGETVAVRLFSRLRQGTDVPTAQRVLDQILKDEVRHRDFGWTLLGWLSELPAGKTYVEQVKRELPAMFRRLKNAYAGPASNKTDRLSSEERSWGLMPNGDYAAILEETLERDYQPRFSAFGIDARAAW